MKNVRIGNEPKNVRREVNEMKNVRIRNVPKNVSIGNEIKNVRFENDFENSGTNERT